MGRRADTAVGTAGDRPGDDMAGNGDPGQMDCVDVATNLSSYTLVMERHKLFRHHSVGSMFVKEDIRRGWTVDPLRRDLGGDQERQKFAVDGWLLASGKPPEMSRSRSGTSTTRISCSAPRKQRARSSDGPAQKRN